MTLRKLNLLLLIMIICSSAVTAQSKLKKSKKSEQQAVDAKSVEKEDVETVYTYIILDLTGKEGSYSAQMVIPKSKQQKMSSDAAITAEKKAAYAAQEQTYPTEIDFLKTMQAQMAELLAVTNDSDERGDFKRFYFRKEVIMRK